MGFSPCAIQRAAEACDTLNFEDLFDFLIGAKKDDPQEHVDAKQAWNEGKHSFCTLVGPSRTIANSINFTAEAGTSSIMSSHVPSRDCENVALWKTFFAMNNINSGLSESDESEDECLGTVWKKKLASLEVKKGCKQSSVSQSKGGTLTGFGIPGFPVLGRPKPLNPLMEGAPFFYFENVASVPNSEWDTIKRHLNGVDPEFVDSKYFSASRRPRGYVHNLPIHGRKLILPAPPMTIFEAFPETKKYWPPWDTREKLNCITTQRACDALCREIRSTVAEHDGKDIPLYIQKQLIQQSKRWNLVWVGPGQVAPLEPHEIELLLGYDHEHSRGASNMTDRYVALGNSFQINTVAYHLSPLKSLYPDGLTVLSLFSGIGGAEVALHKLGLLLKTVIIVEIETRNRNIITSWWKKTCQKGELIIKEDVRELTTEVLAELIDQVGKIDLIIGGSPCNNLSGNNRATRLGLMGKESSLFFEFPRILNIVKQIMQATGYI